MVQKSIAVCLVALMLVSFMAAQVAAAERVSAKLQGGRMVLRLEPSETIRKSITVLNDNPFDVTITMTTAGELAEDIELEEETFTLSPGQEKRAFFEVTAQNEAGTTESNINVRFAPEDGNGVGISATVIVIVDEDGEELPDEEFEELALEDVDVESEDGEGFSFNPSGASVANEGTSGEGVSPIIILMASTGLLVVVLVALMLFAMSKSGGKKGSGRPRE